MALPELLMRPRPRVLVVDVGGTHVKVLATGQLTPRDLPVLLGAARAMEEA